MLYTQYECACGVFMDFVVVLKFAISVAITVNISQAVYGVDEGSGAAQVLLMLSNPAVFEIIVYVMTNDITASGVNNSGCTEFDSESDFLNGVYNGTFSAGLTVTSVDIPLCNDIILEEAETFNISLTSNSHPDDVKNGSPNHVIITIVDNDGKCVGLMQIT